MLENKEMASNYTMGCRKMRKYMEFEQKKVTLAQKNLNLKGLNNDNNYFYIALISIKQALYIKYYNVNIWTLE